MPYNAVDVVAVENLRLFAAICQGFKPLPELKKGAEAHYWLLAFSQYTLAVYRCVNKTPVGYTVHNKRYKRYKRHRRQMHTGFLRLWCADAVVKVRWEYP